MLLLRLSSTTEDDQYYLAFPLLPGEYYSSSVRPYHTNLRNGHIIEDLNISHNFTSTAELYSLVMDQIR